MNNILYVQLILFKKLSNVLDTGGVRLKKVENVLKEKEATVVYDCFICER